MFFSPTRCSTNDPAGKTNQGRSGCLRNGEVTPAHRLDTRSTVSYSQGMRRLQRANRFLAVTAAASALLTITGAAMLRRSLGRRQK